MRFLTQNPGLSVLIRNGEERWLPNGRALSIVGPLTADFRQHDVMPHERELGLKHFSFPGMPVQEDGMTPIDPGNRLAVFDTELQSWSDEDKRYAEEQLLAHQGYDYILVEASALPPPWPGYDSIRSLRRVVELTEATGIDPAEVIAYERINKNRPDFIEALENIGPEEEPREELVEA